MTRLHNWGQLSRIPRPVGGWSGGSEGYTYIPAGSRARVPNPHTLDITELFVKLTEAHDPQNGGPSLRPSIPRYMP